MEREPRDLETEQDDPHTAREELELDLMEADASEAGEAIGQQND